MALGNAFAFVARKWIAGTKVGDAIKRAKEINGMGEFAMINNLGEWYRSMDKVEKAVGIYKELIAGMKRNKIIGGISVKPTQLGDAIDYKIFLRNYIELAEIANRRGFFVWLDAEEYETYKDTMNAYLTALRSGNKVGICLQSMLRESMIFARKIVESGGAIRLVKGAYKESEAVAYQSREEATSNYLRIMKYLFGAHAEFTVATHDDKLINEALKLKKEYRRAKVSFAMLNGIRGNLAARLAREGEEVYIYIPFGDEWFAYSMRRLRERGHAALVIRSIFQQ